LYRFLQQRGLTERQLLTPPPHKKFEAEFSNQIWQSDMLAGPYIQRLAGGKRQAFLHAILDDASRLIPHAQFYTQGLDTFLDCLRQAVAARGLPVRLYVDNAKVYRSPQLARIAASLGMLIVHTPPYQPQGRGKIERYFRSVREQFLTNLDRKQTLSLEDLNERLWLGSTTSITAPNTAPSGPRRCCAGSAISSTSANCRPPQIFAACSSHRLDRVVRRDCTFLLQNRFYEAPPHLASQSIEVRF
jgi:transposase InsO family protein